MEDNEKRMKISDNIIDSISNLNLEEQKNTKKNDLKDELKEQKGSITSTTESIGLHSTVYSSRTINDSSINDSVKSDYIMPSQNSSTQKNTINIPSSIPNFQSQFQFINLTKNFILKCFSDQNETKMLQNMLMENATNENIDSIVKELKGLFRNIMKNKNGNYFCSDLFKVCDQNQRIRILEEISSKISEDSSNRYSTHAIQTLIRFSSSEEEYKLILFSFDKCNLLVACIDANASYVIQEIIKHIPERYRKHFDLLYLEIFCFIAKKKYGVINAKLFCSETKNEETINRIINLIVNDFNDLTNNEYGIYLVKHVLQLWGNKSYSKLIKDIIIHNFRYIYSKKSLHNISDTFLKVASSEDKNKLISVLQLKMNNSNDMNLFNYIYSPISRSANENMSSKNMNKNNNFKRQFSNQMNKSTNNNNYQDQSFPMFGMNQPLIPYQFHISLQNYCNNNNSLNQNQFNYIPSNDMIKSSNNNDIHNQTQNNKSSNDNNNNNENQKEKSNVDK